MRLQLLRRDAGDQPRGPRVMWQGQPGRVGDIGDWTVTDLCGQQAAVQWETPIKELPPDTLLGQTGQDMDPAC